LRAMPERKVRRALIEAFAAGKGLDAAGKALGLGAGAGRQSLSHWTKLHLNCSGWQLKETVRRAVAKKALEAILVDRFGQAISLADVMELKRRVPFFAGNGLTPDRIRQKLRQWELIPPKRERIDAPPCPRSKDYRVAAGCRCKLCSIRRARRTALERKRRVRRNAPVKRRVNSWEATAKSLGI